MHSEVLQRNFPRLESVSVGHQSSTTSRKGQEVLTGPEMVSRQKHPTDRPLAVHRVSWQGNCCLEVGQASGPKESPGLVAFLPYGERASR